MTSSGRSVTVVIPTQNEERYIGRCLRALKGLEYPTEKLQIRVVDNYSSDATNKIVSDFGVRLIEIDKKSIARSRNAGALDARTDLIAFLDADCIPSPYWLKEAVKHFDSPAVVAAGAYPYILEAESNSLQKTWGKLCGRNDRGVHSVDWLSTQNLILRKSIFKKIGGFNEALVTCEDVDLGYRFRNHGTIIYDPNIVVYHLREPKTLRGFFKKEIWHGQSNISGIHSHGLRMSELPSVLAPAVFAGGIIAGIIGLVSKSGFWATGIGFSFAIPITYAVRGIKKTDNILFVFVIYCTYFAARSVALGLEIFGILSRGFRALT
jgi:GT2 family glycosyltransferase